MPIFSQLMFRAVHWAARRGLREEESYSSDTKKLEARRTGSRGETYAYWYLRRQGYVFVARNYTPRGIKGEIDLVGYDGKTLAFVEVRTRTVREDLSALPELSVTREKQHRIWRIHTLTSIISGRVRRAILINARELQVAQLPDLQRHPVASRRNFVKGEQGDWATNRR